jgi:hypothetical protein
MSGQANLLVRYLPRSFFFFNSFNTVLADSERFLEKATSQFRYNLFLVFFLTWEIITQVQYNQITGIDLRYLAGTGPRFTLVKSRIFLWYIGPLYMFEYIECTNMPDPYLNHRISAYISFVFRFRDRFSFSEVVCYQPVITSFPDFRVIAVSSLNLKISRIAGLSVACTFTSEVFDPAGIDRIIHEFQPSIRLLV